jgi:hypothetical protein
MELYNLIQIANIMTPPTIFNLKGIYMAANRQPGTGFNT